MVNQNQATCIRAECLTSVLFSPCVSYKDSYLTHIIIIINSYLNHIKVHTRQEIFVLQTASSEPVDPHKWCGDQRYECPSSVECNPLRLQQVFFCPGSLLSNTEHGNQARFLPWVPVPRAVWDQYGTGMTMSCLFVLYLFIGSWHDANLKKKMYTHFRIFK